MSTHAGEDDQGSSTMAVRIPARGIRDQYSFDFWDDGAYSDVKRILIHHDRDGIYSLRIQYIDENGKDHWGDRHCKSQEFSHEFSHDLILNQVELDYRSEYLTSIHGYYTDTNLTSMTFKSNRTTWGPYGKEEEGTRFSFPLLGAKIVGFHGFSKWPWLNGIGVYVQPISKSKRSLKPQVLKPPQPQHFSLGLYGREDGESWSETSRAIKQFVIYYNDEWIISIQMEYVDENGKSVWSEKHGGDGGTRKEVVLDPDEYLVTIEGSYDYSLDSKSPTDKVQSLTVITNKKTHEPVNKKIGTKFKFPTEERLKVVGIHGTSDHSYLNSIGLYAVLI